MRSALVQNYVKMVKLMALKMSSNILATKLHGKITTAKYEWQKNALKGESHRISWCQKQLMWCLGWVLLRGVAVEGERSFWGG